MFQPLTSPSVGCPASLSVCPPLPVGPQPLSDQLSPLITCVWGSLAQSVLSGCVCHLDSVCFFCFFSSAAVRCRFANDPPRACIFSSYATTYLSTYTNFSNTCSPGDCVCDREQSSVLQHCLVSPHGLSTSPSLSQLSRPLYSVPRVSSC